MMKMLIEASKFLKELRWKPKLLKSLVEPLGQRMLRLRRRMLISLNFSNDCKH